MENLEKKILGKKQWGFIIIVRSFPPCIGPIAVVLIWVDALRVTVTLYLKYWLS